MNSQCGPLRPTQLPSGHCLASSVHATFGAGWGAGCGVSEALVWVQDAIAAANMRSPILNIRYPGGVALW